MIDVNRLYPHRKTYPRESSQVARSTRVKTVYERFFTRGTGRFPFRRDDGPFTATRSVTRSSVVFLGWHTPRRHPDGDEAFSIYKCGSTWLRSRLVSSLLRVRAETDYSPLSFYRSIQPVDFDAYRGRMTINWLDAWNRAIVNRLATIASSFCLRKGETLGIFVNSMNFDESWSKEGRFVIVRLWICLCTFASFF